MRKILTAVFTILLATNNIQSVKYVNMNYALNALNNFIDKSIELGEKQWQNFSIIDSEKIVDNQLEEYGYIFSLKSNSNEGYAIVTCEANACSVVEASYDSGSPFKGYGKNHYLVYYSPLEYLVIEKDKAMINSVSLTNIETNRTVDVDGDKKIRFVNNASTRAVPGETIRYINNYSTKFDAINQNTNYNCVATSIAMCLRYLKNIGTISISFDGNSNPSAIAIRNKITDYYSSHSGADGVVRPAINNFGVNHCSPKISTRDDGFWGNSEQTDISFQTVIDEINSNCPLVMMFNPGRVDSSITVNHATACVGYKTLSNTATGGITFNYTIVRMPNVSSSSTVPTKQISWDYNNIHGYYLVYIG